jgi:hypothetical protein
MERSGPFPDPVSIGVGALASPAHQADVYIQVEPPLAGVPMPIRLENGRGHGDDTVPAADAMARLVINGQIVRGEGPQVSMPTGPGGLLHGVLTSSDVWTGEGVPDCVVHVGKANKAVRFSWDDHRETNQWVMSPSFLPVPGVLTNVLTLRHHRRAPDQPSPSEPFAGHKLRFFVEKVVYEDAQGEEQTLLNTADAPTDLSAWASFPETDLLTGARGAVIAPLTVQDRPELRSVTMVAYDWSVWRQPQTPLAQFVSQVLRVTAPGTADSRKDHKDDSGNKDKTGLKVEFKELGDNFGWDNYTDSTVPWKSVEDGNKTDTVKAEITPASAASQVYFKSTVPGKVTVSPAQASSSPETVTVTGVAKGESEIQANIGGVDGTTCAKIKPKCYTKKLKTIAVTLVHEKATPGPGGDAGYTSRDISDTDITYMLKKVYKQSVQEFTLTRLPAKTVDFDDNHDGQLEVMTPPGWMNSECAKIRDACQSAHDYNIFIVSKPNDGSAGWMSFNQKYAFIHADTGANARTVCHELGHGQGLSHCADSDTENIMYRFDSSTKWRLRKNQWDSLQP